MSVNEVRAEAQALFEAAQRAGDSLEVCEYRRDYYRRLRENGLTQGEAWPSALRQVPSPYALKSAPAPKRSTANRLKEMVAAADAGAGRVALDSRRQNPEAQQQQRPPAPAPRAPAPAPRAPAPAAAPAPRVQARPAASIRIEDIPLKNWPDDVWAIPPIFARSSFFTPAKCSDECSEDPIELDSIGNGKVYRKGVQLPQSDLKFFAEVINLCAQKESRVIALTPRNIMISGGISTSGQSYKYMKMALSKFRASALVYESKSNPIYRECSIVSDFQCSLADPFIIELGAMVFDLLKPKFVDGKPVRYLVHVNKELRALAGNGMAGWLLVFYSSHAEPLPMKIETLMRCAGLNTQSKSMKKDISAALDKLVSIGFLKSFRIDSNNIVHVKKA
jgi:hypothetical protein